MNNEYKTKMMLELAIFSETTNNKIGVITSNGTYYGNLIPEESDNEKYVYIKEFLKIHNSQPENTFLDKEDYILLVDVELQTSFGRPHNLPFAFIFLDHVVGLTSGRFAELEENQ